MGTPVFDDAEYHIRMCLLCISGAPHENDTRADLHEKIEVKMLDAPCADPVCCCCAFFYPWCSIPTIFMLRKKYLDASGDEYTCCQSKFAGCCCIKPGKVGEKTCPCLCQCLESCIFPFIAMSSTRYATMDHYQIGSDEQDRQILRVEQYCQMCACACRLLAMCFDEFKEASHYMTLAANTFSACVCGCMAAQVNIELKKRGGDGAASGAMTTKV